MKRILVTVFAVIMLSSCADGSREAAAPVSDLILPSVDGTIFRLSDHGGRVVLVDFWATWCAPCQEMVPVLSRLHREYSDKGLVVLGVSLDEGGLDVLEPFIREFRVPYRILLGNEMALRAFGGVNTIPTLFIINKEGRLVRKMMGYHTYGELEDQVKMYL